MLVLMIKTSSMGDVIHSLPALTDARLAFPNMHCEWVIEENFSEIPTWHPAVSHVIPVAIRRWRKNWFKNLIRKERINFKHALQYRSYDAVIDAQGLIKSAALISRFATGTKHGGDIYSIREPVASWWYDKRYAINKNQHAVQRIRSLFAKSLNYTLPTTIGDYGILQHFKKNQPIKTNDYLVFLHATTKDKKQWPEMHWRTLINSLQPERVMIKLPWGTHNEFLRAQRLAQGLSYVEVLPKLMLKEIAHILIGAKAIVSVDTGLSQLAAALNCPNITLYGPTNVDLIGGYGHNQISVLSLQKNMAEISPQKIQLILKQLLI
ncbi:lipopolysaccharide heptosyltransferase RfaC [Candidatus Erwinia haradaeae]|uniref:Lipopolysaccharide heptosyltransferase 1 n=1 Tax=Candidatus Erwinia haradaeae TaxID=1922217 RepID=A0A451DP34_9GAMM|nr:lipopolysaccharide heptosyltransferase RfaC [Candidatus Erwinia haradaeae]VFP88462.1 Lipopolysaccharide heptosyltransferase 1 [Candidatus Erwinia haradaeae]